jgi:hypothetical protein
MAGLEVVAEKAYVHGRYKYSLWIHCAEAVCEVVLHSNTVNGGRNEVSFREYCSEAWCDVVVRGMRAGAQTNRRKRAKLGCS